MQSNKTEATTRKLRITGKKIYNDHSDDSSDTISRPAMFDIEEKLNFTGYITTNIIELKGDNLKLSYFQENGFKQPILIKEKTGLGLRVPSKNFTVMDVKACVGGRRLVDVMDVDTQNSTTMTMKEWIEYYSQSPAKREKLLNVISLEFSHTKLATYVDQPTIVRQIDWIECVWPLHLKDSQVESTNAVEKMKYPKVQKYCLMSVKGCYTDFHIDMGGSSVWYHVLHGIKVFWMIPPTPSNLQLFETWVMSGKQNNQFFADLVPDCQRIHLESGFTFFIPTGWIHAVYTLEDSLAFGGNFLHSFNMPLQLEVFSIEERTLVQNKFKFPFFTEIMWYCAERYCSLLLNPPSARSSSPPPKEDSSKEVTTNTTDDVDKKVDTINDESKEDNVNDKSKVSKPIYLTPFEIEGLDLLINWLDDLPAGKKHIPSEVRNASNLLKKLQELVDKHRNDSPKLSITGEPLLIWPIRKRGRGVSGILGSNSASRIIKRCKVISRTSNGSNVEQLSDKNKNSHHHRRVRCKKCEPCTRSDCGECHFCKDMRKFGGPGRMKQTCISRQCMAPLLPSTAACYICDSGDGREAPPYLDDIKEAMSLLMECSSCWKISHPKCVHTLKDNLPLGNLLDELPASWECPLCVNGQQKENTDVFRKPVTNVNVPPNQQEQGNGNGSGQSESDDDTTIASNHVESSRRKCAKVLSLNEFSSNNRQNSNASPNDPAPFVVRPAPIKPPPMYVKMNNNKNHPLDRSSWQNVFLFLDNKSLVNLMCVCKTFCKWLVDRKFWQYVDVSRSQLSIYVLMGIVRRQPLALNLSNTNISKDQLEWLLQRLPHLHHLFIGSNSIATCSALSTTGGYHLRSLDISWVEGLNDGAIRFIIPQSNFSAHAQRLKFVSGISLSGTDITDAGVNIIIQHMKILVKIELAYCMRISDDILKHLKNAEMLMHIVLTGCHQLTDKVLDPIPKCNSILNIIELNHCHNVSVSACHNAMTLLKQMQKKVTISCGPNVAPYKRLVDMVHELIEV